MVKLTRTIIRAQRVLCPAFASQPFKPRSASKFGTTPNRIARWPASLTSDHSTVAPMPQEVQSPLELGAAGMALSSTADVR